MELSSRTSTHSLIHLLIFHSLPPYSPDLNKIENSWSWLKSRIRHQLTHFDSLREAIENVLRLVS